MFDGTLGFLAFGNMGQAIARGLIDTQTVPGARLVAFDIDASKTAAFANDGLVAANSPEDLCKQADVLLLAPKPQMMETALDSIRASWMPDTLIISIAAGISSRYIQERLGAEARVARVMPNTPALVGAGATGISYSANIQDEDRRITRTIFESVGVAVEVPESDIDAVTALSGSGPAYYFYLVECFIDGAKELGLTEEAATLLAGQTLLGAGKLLSESGESAATLRERVTSKGGTTAAALETLRASNWSDIAAKALKSAADRSRELGS